MKTRTSEKIYDLDGMLLKVPVHYDERTGKYLEVYPDFQAEPIYTIGGYRCTAAVEDACSFGVTEGFLDCGSCVYYGKAKEGDLIGICKCREMMRKDMETASK